MAEYQQNCCRISGCAAVYPQFRKLAVERRPADSQAARHFGHAAAIVADGEADDVRLYVRERANVAVGLIKHDSNAFVRKLRIGRLVFAHRTCLRRDLREIRRRESVALARSEEHTSELQSLMRIPYAVFCLKKKNKPLTTTNHPPLHH